MYTCTVCSSLVAHLGAVTATGSNPGILPNIIHNVCIKLGTEYETLGTKRVYQKKVLTRSSLMYAYPTIFIRMSLKLQ